MRRLALALALLTGGCATTKLLRLENELLKTRVAELETEVEALQADARPSDFVVEVTPDTVAGFLSRAGYPRHDQASANLFTVPIAGEHARFQVSIQLFEREKVLYFSVHDYLRLEDAASSQSMVLLLTQLAALNYELLLGKFQLNPRSGEISLSVEIQLDDGLGYRTFEAVLAHVIITADRRHPELMRAARGQGI